MWLRVIGGPDPYAPGQLIFSQSVYFGPDGSIEKRYIHHLVAESYLGHIRNGHRDLVIHKDQNKKNNSLNNLTVGSYKDLTEQYRIYKNR